MGGFFGCIDKFIPVARITDLLLQPNEPFTYNGAPHLYPDIRLVYRAGGNPFHYHQDLNRLQNAWQKPETIAVHENSWTSAARHVDIVLPASTSVEWNDLGYASQESILVWMSQLLEPAGEARGDYAILSALARRLGLDAEFTEGRAADQ